MYNKRETTDRPEEVHSLQLRVVLKLFAPKLHLFLHASEVVLLGSLLQVARIVQQSVRRRTRRRGAVWEIFDAIRLAVPRVVALRIRAEEISDIAICIHRPHPSAAGSSGHSLWKLSHIALRYRLRKQVCNQRSTEHDAQRTHVEKLD